MSTEKGNILTLDDIFKSDSEDEEPLVEQIVAREVEPAPKVEDLDMKLLRDKQSASKTYVKSPKGQKSFSVAGRVMVQIEKLKREGSFSSPTTPFATTESGPTDDDLEGSFRDEIDEGSRDAIEGIKEAEPLATVKREAAPATPLQAQTSNDNPSKHVDSDQQPSHVQQTTRQATGNQNQAASATASKQQTILSFFRDSAASKRKAESDPAASPSKKPKSSE